jgi:hypothetical protein
VKWIRDTVGEQRRLWYDDAEIEQIVEAELAKFRKSDKTDIDLEGFAEEYLGVFLDQHAALPDHVLGMTEFIPGRRCRIRINSALTAEAEATGATVSKVGRWRATVAHEIGHVLLHPSLFSLHDGQATLFDDFDLDAAGMRCFRKEIGIGVGSDWREVQANKAMAALLMPRAQFAAAFEQAVQSLPTGVSPRAIVNELAGAFLVSNQATLIRIHELGLGAQAITLFE